MRKQFTYKQLSQAGGGRSRVTSAWEVESVTMRDQRAQVDDGTSRDSVTHLVEHYAREHPEAGEWARKLREAVEARENAGASNTSELPVAQYSTSAG